MFKHILVVVVVIATFVTSPVHAHYLWVTIDRSSPAEANANIYFEESPSVGDGYYLDPFVKAKTTWIRTVERQKPELLPTREKREGEDRRWLTADVPYGVPRAIESYGKFGVYRYGDTDVLLHYYARLLDVRTIRELRELARAEHMKLDLVPNVDGNDLTVRLLWKGKPIAASTVHIRGPKGLRATQKTDEAGAVRLTIPDAGEYRFRAGFEVKRPGRDGDDEYSSIRHNATLILSVPLRE